MPEPPNQDTSLLSTPPQFKFLGIFPSIRSNGREYPYPSPMPSSGRSREVRFTTTQSRGAPSALINELLGNSKINGFTGGLKSASKPESKPTSLLSKALNKSPRKAYIGALLRNHRQRE
jgi:hypothetical protein